MRLLPQCSLDHCGCDHALSSRTRAFPDSQGLPWSILFRYPPLYFLQASNIARLLGVDRQVYNALEWFEALKIAFVKFTHNVYNRDECAVVTAVTLQQGFAYNSCGVCMFFPCRCGFSRGNPASFHCLEICMWEIGHLMSLI